MKIARTADFKALAVIGGALIGLLAVEIALRIMASLDRCNYPTFLSARGLLRGKPRCLSDYIQPSAYSDLVYELVPSVKGDQLSERFQRPVTINADGMRDRAFAVPKPPGVFRLAVLGDSIAFGWGVADEENYPKLLERYLNAGAKPDARFEVLNFGVFGYNTAMEAAQYERKARKYGSDVVLLQSVDNDRELPNFLARKRNPWSPRRSFLLDRLKGVPLARELFDAPPPNGANGRAGQESGGGEFPEEFRSMRGDQAVVQALERIARMTQEDGAVFVQFVSPSLPQPGHFQTRAAQPGELAEFLNMGKRCGCRQIDLTPDLVDAVAAFGLKPEQLLVWPGNGHPNEIGHRVIAWSLVRHLNEMGLFDDQIGDDLSAVEARYRAEAAQWMEKPAWNDPARAGDAE